MSREIADILGAHTVQFSHLIGRLEERSGRHGHDLRLYSDMRSRALRAVQELGLDPSDTVSGELYFALQERAHAGNTRLAARIGIDQDDSPDLMLNKVMAWVSANTRSSEVWVCKPTLVRSFLKKQPPKLVMKALGLRSVDSALKRNNSAELLTLASSLESEEWVKKFKLNYKRCKPTDFDTKTINFLVIPKDRASKIGKAGFPISRIVSPNYELGSFMLIPPQYRFPLDVLIIAVSLAEAISDMRKYSSYYRTLSVRKDFGQHFYDVSRRGIHQASRTVSEVGWNSIHRHLVGNEYFLKKIEQPYLSRDDFIAESSLELLARHDPQFEYWKDLEYVFYHHDKKPAVSLNLVDVVIGATNRSPYENGSVAYGQTQLWEELWSRYLAHDNVAEEIIDQFIQN